MAEHRILMGAETLATHLQRPGLAIVDCRFDLGDPNAGRRAYEIGHIPGSVYLDLDRDLAGPVGPDTGRHPLPDVGDLEARLGAVGIGNDTEVVVYDDANGAVAARAWWILRWLGHDAVFVLDGGLARWQSLELPLEAGTVSAQPQTFRASLRPELVVTTEEIIAASHQPDSLHLYDARDRGRFRGEREPIDPVAGHIPGSSSLPFTDFVNADGTWLDLAERERLLLGALGGYRDAAWCVMCGSGVTACHLAISALEAGLPEPRVYVGSWSEWIRDSARPVARGDG